MALKDQPYIPLYIQDVLTDEKLMLCSAEAHGVYFRLICILHKQPEYGCILLKQKFKQSESTCLNFAKMLAAFLPFTVDTIKDALQELSDEDVIQFEGDKLSQKRMVKDHATSVKRSKAGSKGGRKTASKKEVFAKEFAKAKTQANPEYEYVYENEVDNEFINNGVPEKIEWQNLVSFEVEPEVQELWLKYERQRITDGMSAYNDGNRIKAIENLYKSAGFDIEKVKHGLNVSISGGRDGAFAKPLYYNAGTKQNESTTKGWRSDK